MSKVNAPRIETTADCVRSNNEHGVNNYNHYDELGLRRAQGAYLYTLDDRKVLDGLSSYGAVLSHGWSVPRKALISCSLDAVSAVVHTPQRARFQEAITRFTGFDRVFTKSGGGEAVETVYTGLFRLAEMRGIKDPVILLVDNFFHGRMRSSQTNSNDPDQYEGKGPRVPGFQRIQRNTDSLEAAVKELGTRIIGIVLEKHQGEAGPIFDRIGKNSFYASVHRIARRVGFFVVVDEVQTGLYRCGHIMSWQEDGETYRPDAIVLAKALGGGIIPISAVVGTNEFMEAYNAPGKEGATFSGFPVACAVATSVIEFMEDNPWLGQKAEEVGKRFHDNLQGIPGVSVTYRGAMIGIEIFGQKSTIAICREMLKGEMPFFAKNGHDGFIRVSPPFLAIQESDIDEVCEKTVRPVLLNLKI